MTEEELVVLGFGPVVGVVVVAGVDLGGVMARELVGLVNNALAAGVVAIGDPP